MEGQDSQMSQSLISDGEEVAEIEDVLNDEFEINSNGKAVKKKRKDGPRKADMTSEENALILNWMEFRYKELYGRGQSSSVADDKKLNKLIFMIICSIKRKLIFVCIISISSNRFALHAK